jgi:hypothetical protein
MPFYGWLALAVVVAILLTSWVTFTATRLDRLHARVDAAQAALDVQLVRRAAAVQHVADSSRAELGPATADRLAEVAHRALRETSGDREPIENEVGKAANELAGLRTTLAPAHAPALREVAEAAAKVVIARGFFNDAVRDTRALRGRRMPRLFRLAGHRELPQFFDIDDSTQWPTTDLS